jgi:hypothetical protein
MDQNLWGPSMWFILHSVCFTYPFNPSLDDKKSYYNFFKSLGHVLPCSVCRKHFKRNFAEHPIQLNSRLDLCKWIVLVHNEINSRCGKPSMNLNEVVELYEKETGKDIYLTPGEDKNHRKNRRLRKRLAKCDPFYLNSSDSAFFLIILVGMVVILYWIRSSGYIH